MKNSFEIPHFKSKVETPKKTKVEQQENRQEKENAKSIEIAKQTGDYGEILERLRRGDLWETQLKQAHGKFDSQINAADFPTKESAVWEMLTVLNLYDQETAEHCIATYTLIKKRIEKVMTKNLVLAETLRDEDVEMEEFYFASLTHDIGKVCIPPFVISNSLAQRNWNDLFLEMVRAGELKQETKRVLQIPDKTKLTDSELLQKLSENDLRSKDVVPIKKGLSDYELFCLEEQWGLSGEQSLMGVIDKHANFSEEILKSQGFESTGELVGAHHHKQNNEVDLSTFRVTRNESDLADILHLGDVEQALKSRRHYKNAFSKLDTIMSLKEEIENSDVGRAIAYFWIKDKRDHFVEKNGIETLNEKDKQSLRELDTYIASFESGESKGEIDKWTEIHLKS